MDEKEQGRQLLEDQMKSLGVSVDEITAAMYPDPEKEAAALGGAVARPGQVESEKRDAAAQATPPAGQPSTDAPTSESLVPLTDESLEEALRFIKKKVGAVVRKKARKAKKYYRKVKAKLRRMAKKWKKSAAGKRFLKKYKKAKARLGDVMKKAAGRKRLQITGMELSAKLHEQVGKPQAVVESTDIEILERGAVIVAILGDRFEDMDLASDAESARKTSDGIVAMIEKYEGKGAIPDDEMVSAVKAIGVCIDHYEKLEGEDLPLTA